ncbi:MAG: hypothetical protein ACXIUL_06650 [Wenzhouxiangella sp.]
MYVADNARLEAKRSEIREVVTALEIGLSDEQIDSIIDAFCRLSPPLEKEQVMEMLVVPRDGRTGGQSIKPGNIFLNWRSLVSKFGDAGFASAAAVHESLLIPLAALCIWRKIRDAATIELSSSHAIVIYAMWLRAGSDNIIDSEDAFEMARLVFRNNNLPELDADRFQDLLQDLVALKCIELKDEGRVRLIEWVNKRYR